MRNVQPLGWVWLLAACERTPETTPGTIEATCAPAPDNVLRYVCDVHVDPPGPVEVAFQPVDSAGPQRVIRSAAEAADHSLTLWLMAPRTAYEWTASASDGDGVEATGLFETGEAPSGARIVAEVTGTASFPYVLAASPCDQGGVVVLMSTSGELLWYHAFADANGELIRAATFTEDRTVLVLVGERLAEVDFLGGRHLELAPTVDFEHPLHHDVFRRGGLTYALHEEPFEWEGTSYVFDGFYVFDASGALVEDWRLAEHFQPPVPNAMAVDYTHANSIFVDDAGDVYLSMRNVSALAKIAGPNRTNPGEILWRVSGDVDRMPFGSDFTLASSLPAFSPSFELQHHFHVLADGRFALFDNRSSTAERSRVLVWAMDGTEARLEEGYQLPEHCGFQGSSFFTAGGNPVGGCASSQAAYEFDAGVPEPSRWSMRLGCFDGSESAVPRFVPLEEADL